MIPALLLLGLLSEVIVVSLVWYDLSVTLNGDAGSVAANLLIDTWPLLLAGGGAALAHRLRARPGWARLAAGVPLGILSLFLVAALLLWLFPPSLHAH